MMLEVEDIQMVNIFILTSKDGGEKAPASKSQQRIVNNPTINVKNAAGMPRREREFSNRALINHGHNDKAATKIKSRLMSRDDRLKAPKSSQSKDLRDKVRQNINEQKLSNKILTKSIDYPYQNHK